MRGTTEQPIFTATFTAKQAAQYLGISYQSLLTRIRGHENPVPHFLVGRKYLFRRHALDKWMADHDGVHDIVCPPEASVGVSDADIVGKIILSMIDEQPTRHNLSKQEGEYVFRSLEIHMKQKRSSS